MEFKADRVFLPMAFGNLVDNCLKHGGENLSQIKIGYEESNDCHIFSVSDDGVGMGTAEFKNFFGLFQQHEPSAQVDGAGLGLATASKIAERLGGNLQIKSGSRRETTFSISIPKDL
jgi:signal transduction histidine kinase